MKISQLVETKTKMPYYESLAIRLPRGIKSQQQLLDIGYRIAVEDLGLTKAETLSENFAVKLINSYHTQCLEEGVGSFLGKAAGHTVGAIGAAGRGISNSWKDAKKGYADAKASWSDQTSPTASGSSPTASGSSTPASGAAANPGVPYNVNVAAPSPGGVTPTPPVAGTPPATTKPGAEDPKQLRAQAAKLAQKADEIEKQQAATATPAPAPTPAAPTVSTTGATAAAPTNQDDREDPPLFKDEKAAGSTPPPESELAKLKTNAGISTASNQGSGFQAAGQRPAITPSYNLNLPKTPAAAATTPAAPADSKLTSQQIAAKKAELQGKRAAGKTTATQTGSGFKDYVAGSQTNMVGADATGAPVFKKTQRESVGFSSFLGVHI